MSTLSKKNPFAFGKPITLDTLGDLFAHHRLTFGGFTMEEKTAEQIAAEAAAAEEAKKGAEGYKPPATQEELNRIIGDRLAREREKYADYAEIKKKAEAHDAKMAEAMTDAEKAADAARKEGETSALEKANGRIVRSEARAVASELKFRNPTLALAAIDLSDVKVNDDGEPDAAAIKTKLEDLAKADPYLVDDGKKPAPKPDRSQGGGGGNDTASSVAKGRDAYAARHQKQKTS